MIQKLSWIKPPQKNCSQLRITIQKLRILLKHRLSYSLKQTTLEMEIMQMH
ncbi:hypothetical protein OIU78_020052 [Salix suchowensis]|nr:hypothetical protein OIU78_020052 [Salix suchowensis]